MRTVLDELYDKMYTEMWNCPYCNATQTFIDGGIEIERNSWFFYKKGYHFGKRCEKCGQVYTKEEVIRY